MQVTISHPSAARAQIDAIFDTKGLEAIYKRVINQLRHGVSAPGFRPGKAPDNVVERQIGEQRVQAEVIEAAATQAYSQATKEQAFRAIEAPHVEVKKFVPYSELELVFSFEVFPTVKLPQYKKIKQTKPVVRITEDQVSEVIEGLRLRAGKRAEAKRTAQVGDEVTVDFKGERDGVAVAGAAAQKYPVIIGSNRLVPGFEAALVGLRAGDDKEFTVIFPKDYGEPTLQNKRVKFKVTVHRVDELKLPAIDDKFASQIGPFGSLKELQADVRKQLEAEYEQSARREQADRVVRAVVDKSRLELPEHLLARQLESLRTEFEGNIRRDGQSPEDYLQTHHQSQQDVDELLKKEAAHRVKTALVLNAIAEAEGLKVTPEELEVRVQALKGQYQDTKMQAELEKPESRQQIADQLLIEKTVSKLVEYATR